MNERGNAEFTFCTEGIMHEMDINMGLCVAVFDSERIRLLTYLYSPTWTVNGICSLGMQWVIINML